jgi:hypothetical protein
MLATQRPEHRHEILEAEEHCATDFFPTNSYYVPTTDRRPYLEVS